MKNLKMSLSSLSTVCCLLDASTTTCYRLFGHLLKTLRLLVEDYIEPRLSLGRVQWADTGTAPSRGLGRMYSAIMLHCLPYETVPQLILRGSPSPDIDSDDSGDTEDARLFGEHGHRISAAFSSQDLFKGLDDVQQYQDVPEPNFSGFMEYPSCNHAVVLVTNKPLLFAGSPNNHPKLAKRLFGS